MKKILYYVAALLLCVGIVWATVTETHTEGAGANIQRFSGMKKVAVVFEAADLDSTVTETIDSIYGIVYRITIVPSGTDGDYDVALTDENSITIFEQTGLDSDPTASFAYVLYEDDTEGNPWGGVPVGGAMTLTITDAAALTGLTVSIYCFDFWQ